MQFLMSVMFQNIQLSFRSSAIPLSMLKMYDSDTAYTCLKWAPQSDGGTSVMNILYVNMQIILHAVIS